jgi:response regulator NasT
MAPRKKRGIFLVSATQSSLDHLSAMVPSGMFQRTVTALGAGEARRRAGETGCQVVVINSPLPEENGLALARDLARRYPVGVLLLVRGEQLGALAPGAEEAGVGLVPKPLTRQTLQLALSLSLASATRLETYAARADTFRRRAEDLTLVTRAKSLLMAHQGMTEPQAHRHIEKTAMDQGKHRRDVAEQILQQYETTSI